MPNNNGLDNVGEGTVAKPPEQHLNRACEFCRSLKVRCIVDAESSSQQCQRCFKAKRSCVFAPPQKRRQRKRTDARVAELEREVRAMRSLLKEGRPSSPGASHQQDQAVQQTVAGERRDSAHTGTESGSDEVLHPPSYTSSPSFQSQSPGGGMEAAAAMAGSEEVNHGEASSLDVVDRGIVSMEVADDFLTLFSNDLVHHFPGLVFLPDGTTAHSLRRDKPALFVAILAAAALGVDAQLARILHEEITHIIAEKVIISGIKSLELVQVLLLTVAYSYPPGTTAKLQFYQYTHLAVTMALDLGITSKPRVRGGFTWEIEKKASDGSDQEERSRTILCCYLMAASLAMMMRRPMILNFNKWMQVCLDGLERSPGAQDKALVSTVKLQRIADETSTAFGFDDPSTSISMADSVLQVIMKGFERKIEEWSKAIVPGTMNVSMTIHYHAVKITTYVFAMDGGQHDAQEFKQNHLTLPRLDDEPRKCQPLSNLQINATIKCVDSLHTLLDTILALDEEGLRRIPNFFFARAMACLITLLNIFFLAATTNLGELIEPQNLKQGQYLSDMIRALERAIGSANYIVPSHWLRIIKKLDDWHDQCQKRLDEPWGVGRQTSKAPPVTEQQDQMNWDRAGLRSTGQFEEPNAGKASSGSTAFWPNEYDYLQTSSIPQNPTSDTVLPELASMDMADCQMGWNQDDLAFSNSNTSFNSWMLDGLIPSNPYYSYGS